MSEFPPPGQPHADRPRYALASTQMGMWFHAQANPRSGVDLEQIVCRLDEALDAPAFERAFRTLVARHDTLHTRFVWDARSEAAEPEQELVPGAQPEVQHHDWRERDTTAAEVSLNALLREDREQGFDLSQAPLTRLHVVQTGASAFIVVWSFHHAVLDGRSFPIALRELFGLYENERRGTASSAEAHRAASIKDHLARHALRDCATDEAFWRERLAEFEAPTTLGVSTGSDPANERQTNDWGQCEHTLSKEATAALEAFGSQYDLSLNTLVQGAWAVVLARLSGTDDVVFGATRAGRARDLEGAEQSLGCFINTLPVRARLRAESPTGEWLRALQDDERAVRAHEFAPLYEVQSWADIAPGSPLFESIVVFDRYELSKELRRDGGDFLHRNFELIEKSGFALTLYGYHETELQFRLAYDPERFSSTIVDEFLDHLCAVLHAFATAPDAPLGDLPTTGPQQRRRIAAWNETARTVPEAPIHSLIEAQAQATPSAVAVRFEETQLSYAELNSQANRLAHELAARGAKAGDVVALCVGRSLELIIGMLAILKTGAGYLPLDPEYPTERLAFMLEDSETRLIVTEPHLAETLPALTRIASSVSIVPVDFESYRERSSENPGAASSPNNIAYMIYTSGSTGRPKGVVVEHRNVANFFVGMDERVGSDPPGVWLAVTSVSFDISVLELLWTLARGFEVVLYEEELRAEFPEPTALAIADHRATPKVSRDPALSRALDFSLFYFGPANTSPAEEHDSDIYQLLLEGARFADAHDFSAVWTPERHFHDFGGAYPNPAVTGAAIAAITERIDIRAGSVVLPLHHPARVAEEWAVVDQLSGGRVGIAFASGWHPRDFIFQPDSFANAREGLLDSVGVVQQLWRGESISFPAPGGESISIRTFPRPVQPELPTWITTAGNPESFRRAGASGANVLTHLLGQTPTEVAERVSAYREARAAAGHPGPGHVAIMLHTFVGDDLEAVRAAVREPMIEYLRSATDLIKKHTSAWTAYKRRDDGSIEDPNEIPLESLDADELDDLLEFSFARYFDGSALFGPPDRCMDLLAQLADAGVDEIACLVDFGVDPSEAAAHLENLDTLRALAQQAASQESSDPAPVDRSIGALIERYGVTHLQCTPSMLKLIAQDERNRTALSRLEVLLLGGEELPLALASEAAAATGAKIFNMYGPTETTIWSSTDSVARACDEISVGTPIANTSLYLLDAQHRVLPIGAEGDLYIGGAGVARGYWKLDELTAERFLPDPFSSHADAHMYKTGDRARWRDDGRLDLLGRDDHQVKIRGHRIELGEIESRLCEHTDVRDATVLMREDRPGELRLVAYTVAAQGCNASPGELRSALRKNLPEFMLPAQFVALKALPLTLNRKIDRKALPAPPAEGTPTSDAVAAAASPIEARIAAIWSDILGVKHIDPSANFFDLGGHSLLAVQAHRRMKQEFAADFRITTFFRFPTLRALAEHLGTLLGEAESGEPARADDRTARRRERATRRRGGARDRDKNRDGNR